MDSKLTSKSSGKSVLGVMVDGADLRIAHMGKEKGETVIYSLESTTLPTRLGKLRPAEVAQPAAAGETNDDVFGFDEPDTSEHAFDSETEQVDGSQLEDVSASLINIFAKYPLNNNRIAVNIPEGQATYYSFESDFGFKGQKLKKRLNEEIAPLTGGTLETAVIDHFANESGGLTVIVSEGNIPLIEEFIEIKNFLAGGVPYVCQVSSNEISLINLVRATMDPPEDQITAVIYIGADFSRAIIMKGGGPISFIQSIREGYNSRQVCKTLFSKILLEQEESGLPEINKIILAGEIGMTRAHEFFEKQFPDAEVHPITSGDLDTSNLKSEELAVFPNYAIPISMAWEALDKKESKFIRTNLMPRFVKDSQKPLRVAWHGFLLLGVIFACAALLTYQGINRFGTIRATKQSIKQKQETINSLQQDIMYVNQLQAQLSQYKSNLEFLDAVVLDSDKWSRLFHKFTTDFRDVKNIWIDRVVSTPEGFQLTGRSLTRDRVPALAAGFGGVQLNQVSRVISEAGEQVYEFDFDAQIPPPVEPELPADIGKTTDRPASTSGSIPGATKSGQEAAKPEQQQKSAVPTQKVTPEAAKTEATKQEATTEPTAKSVKSKEEQRPSTTEKADPVPSGNTKTAQKSVTTKETPKTPPVSKQQSTAKVTEKEQLKKQPVSTKSTKKAGAKKVSTDTQKSSPGAQNYYKNGIDYIKNNDVKSAYHAFSTVVTKYPDAPQAASAYYWMGECAYSMKDYQQAIQLFETSLNYKGSPKREASMVMLGMSYARLGKTDQAVRQFKALLEAFPEGEYTETAKRKLEKLGG